MRGERSASLHRLLGQSLRASMGIALATRVLSCSARAVEAHWAFDAADTSTWAAATAGIDHVQAIGRHTEALLRAAAAAGEATTQRSARGGGGSGSGGGSSSSSARCSWGGPPSF